MAEPRPRRKQGVKALEHRQRMVHLAIQKESQLGEIVLNQRRFTVLETLPVLKARFKGAQLYFVMGDDMLAHFSDAEWPHLTEFINDVQLIIGLRQMTVSEFDQWMKVFEETRGEQINYTVFQAETPEISSTRVRQTLRAGRQPAELDPVVYKYIQVEGLYASAEET